MCGLRWTPRDIKIGKSKNTKIEIGNFPKRPMPKTIQKSVDRWVCQADRIDAARLFPADALKNPFRALALNAHGNAGVFRLECLGESFRGRKLERRVEGNLAFLAGGFDKRRRDCTRLSRGGFKGFREDGAGGHRRRRFKHIASGMRRLSHGSHLH
jgi:hypothetical protein